MSKRAIFIETDTPTARGPAGQPSKISAAGAPAARLVLLWLMSLFALVAMMILVGGLTRLTDSGLSITEWRPVLGAFPPLTEADWLAEFAKYQASPEYQLQNKGMDLAAFKFIYWWEWGHRQLGRFVGLIWALGFLVIWARGMVPKGWSGRFWLLGALGGMQGAIGWWMVHSGLSGRVVDVASYRLATHLGLAFIILSIIAWYLMALRRGALSLYQARRTRQEGLARLVTLLFALAFLQIILGALVAGIDAGRGYIDWPLMNGQFLPDESFAYTPFLSNFTENAALVQFNHRMLGYLVALAALYAWWQSRKSAYAETRLFGAYMLGAVLFQVVWGILTVMQAAPLHLAIIHQAGAILLIVLVLRLRFAAIYPQFQSVRG